MKDAGDKITDADKAPVNAAIAKLREVGKGTDKDAIQRAIQNLQQAAHALGQHIQRSGGGPSPEGAAPPSGTPGGSPGGKDDVMDAEFEVKK